MEKNISFYKKRCLNVRNNCAIWAIKKYKFEEIKFNLESYGYEVKFSESCSLSYKGYLAGNDDIRARDIEGMFLDKDVDMIMCLRGGYGTTRILDKINYEIINKIQNHL